MRRGCVDISGHRDPRTSDRSIRAGSDDGSLTLLTESRFRRHVILAGTVLAAVLGIVVVTYLSVAHARRSTSRAAVVLLQDNTILILSSSGRVVHRTRLGQSSPHPLAGRYLVRTRSGSLVAVASGPTNDFLVFADTRGGVTGRRALPRGIHFRAIEIGRATGRLYLAGEIKTARVTKFGTLAKRAVLTVMSPSGQLLSTTTLRRPDGAQSRRGPLDWSIYDIAVSRNERRVYVSYHGPNTAGADWVSIDHGIPRRCSSASEKETCIERVHGSIEPFRSGVLATLGTPPLLGEFSTNGKELRLWRSGLGNAHLMEFARLRHRVFTIESCVKTGGMTVVDLTTARARTLHAPAPATPLRGLPASAVCGERISVGASALITVMKRGTLSGIGGVMLFDLHGRLLKWIPLKPRPIDVLVIAY